MALTNFLDQSEKGKKRKKKIFNSNYCKTYMSHYLASFIVYSPITL